MPDARADAAGKADFSAARWRAPSMQHQQDGRIHKLAGETMGTNWSLSVVNAGFQTLEPVHALVQAVLDEVIAQMSNWEPGSLISRFNASSPGSRTALPAEFAAVLGAAMHWAERSGGALDPTMGALVSLWGFGPRAQPLTPHTGDRPPDDAVLCLLGQSGYGQLPWRPGQPWLEQPGSLQLDLCGIAKGFAVDWVVQRLRQEGWASGLFEIGGELRGWGERPDGRPWRIQLGSGGVDAPMAVALRDGALATSGDYWHHFFSDGKRYSHTIDPRTGSPIEHGLASVTVHHDECMHADALATVLTVMGAKEGMEFARSNDIAAVFREHPPLQDHACGGLGQSCAGALLSPAWKARFAT